MSEQIRAQHPNRHVRRRPQGAPLTDTQSVDILDDEARQKLSRLDTALNDYLTDTSAADSAANIGSPQKHAQAMPLSDEALVNGFRQTRGE